VTLACPVLTAQAPKLISQLAAKLVAQRLHRCLPGPAVQVAAQTSARMTARLAAQLAAQLDTKSLSSLGKRIYGKDRNPCCRSRSGSASTGRADSRETSFASSCGSRCAARCARNSITFYQDSKDVRKIRRVELSARRTAHHYTCRTPRDACNKETPNQAVWNPSWVRIIGHAGGPGSGVGFMKPELWYSQIIWRRLHPRGELAAKGSTITSRRSRPPPRAIRRRLAVERGRW